jgi:prepilin-type N-terminal cleavage/methylation domain-containing protein
MTRTVSKALVGGVMAVLLAAGAAKLADLAWFAGSVAAWGLLPRWSVLPLAVAVPVAELAVAGAWLLGLERRWTVAGAWALLGAFSAAYAAHAAFAHPPRCSCFGRVQAFRAIAQDTPAVLGRNGALLGALALAGALSPRRQARAGPARPAAIAGAPGRGAAPGAPGPRAFTLLETLLAVALVGVLVATLAPSLAGARRAGHRAAALALLRTHAGVFSAYTAEWKDVYPYFTDPAATWTIVRCGDVADSLQYFAASDAWPIALAGHGYYDGECFHRSFNPPGALKHGWPWTPIMYSSTCIAHPRFWNPATRTGPDQWVPVRTDQVLYPAKKGLFLNLAMFERIPRGIPGSQYTGPPPRPDRGAEVGFCDGSAAWWRYERLNVPYRTGEGYWEGSVHYAGRPVLHTIDGVRGRDTP